MKQFDQWFHEENRQLEEGYWSPIREGGKQALYAAYRAGMLEAADIAEAIDLSCDEFVTLEMIAEEIRRAVE